MTAQGVCIYWSTIDIWLLCGISCLTQPCKQPCIKG
jgi:hypothetical protein